MSNSKKFNSFDIKPYVKEGNTHARTYELTYGRMRFFLTPELVRDILEQREQLLAYLEETKPQMLTNDEAKFERKASQAAEKALKAKRKADIAARAVELMKQNKGMDWDSAQALAESQLEQAA